MKRQMKKAEPQPTSVKFAERKSVGYDHQPDHPELDQASLERAVDAGTREEVPKLPRLNISARMHGTHLLLLRQGVYIIDQHAAQ